MPCRLRALCPRVTAVGAYPGAAKWYRACLDVPRSRAPTLETVNPECPEDPMVHNDGRKLNRKVLAAYLRAKRNDKLLFYLREYPAQGHLHIIGVGVGTIVAVVEGCLEPLPRTYRRLMHAELFWWSLVFGGNGESNGNFRKCRMGDRSTERSCVWICGSRYVRGVPRRCLSAITVSPRGDFPGKSGDGQRRPPPSRCGLLGVPAYARVCCRSHLFSYGSPSLYGSALVRAPAWYVYARSRFVSCGSPLSHCDALLLLSQTPATPACGARTQHMLAVWILSKSVTVSGLRKGRS